MTKTEIVVNTYNHSDPLESEPTSIEIAAGAGSSSAQQVLEEISQTEDKSKNGKVRRAPASL